MEPPSTTLGALEILENHKKELYRLNVLHRQTHTHRVLSGSI